MKLRNLLNDNSDRYFKSAILPLIIFERSTVNKESSNKCP
jgi:hypothetical protein